MPERRASRRLMNQINVVPYIDVMLVLLVIFMVTAPLIQPGQVDLPEIGQSPAPPVAPLEVLIRNDAALALRDPGGEERAVTRQELARLVRQKQTQNPNQPVVISADKNVRYQAVMEIMDLLHKEQIKKVGLLVKPGAK